MYYLVDFGARSKKAWIKVEHGVVEDSSTAFIWAVSKKIEDVEGWCEKKGLSIRKLHGNVKNIKHYI